MKQTTTESVMTCSVLFAAAALVAAGCTGPGNGGGPAATSDTTTSSVAAPGPPGAPTSPGPVNPHLADSPWPMPHQGPAQRASTVLPGVETDDAAVQLVDFEDDAGIERRVNQTSPFLVLGGQRYRDDPGARAVWGASLTDLYKYVLVDGEARYVDHQPLRRDPLSIHWNLLTLADGRVVVASPLGATLVDDACRTEGSALLVFDDGDRVDAPIGCVGALAAGPEEVASCRGSDGRPVGPVEPRYSVTGLNVTYSGEVMTYLRLPTGSGGRLEHYLAAAEPDLSGWADCTFVSSSEVTNNLAVEPDGENGSAVYVATSTSFVKLIWDVDTGRLERRWERPVDLRTRTGTTPTLLGDGEDGLVAVVDAPCAVVDPFRGTIDCSDDGRPARVVAVHRGDDDDVVTAELPDEIRTVENSPSASGRHLVVAAYGGYSVDPSVRGVAALQWHPDEERLELDWFNDEVQMNGITTISEASGLVYGSGAARDGSIRLSGIRMWDHDDVPAGDVVVDVPIVDANETERAFDQGNSTVIADDGTMLWASSEGFVVVRP